MEGEHTKKKKKQVNLRQTGKHYVVLEMVQMNIIHNCSPFNLHVSTNMSLTAFEIPPFVYYTSVNFFYDSVLHKYAEVIAIIPCWHPFTT